MSYKLNLTKALNSLDRRDKKLYESLSEEEKKGFQAFVLMRYMSSVPDNDTLSYISLVSTNEVVNRHFWETAKEVELQAKLLAVCGLGQKTYRKWIPLKKPKNDRLRRFVQEVHKNVDWYCNEIEYQIYLNKFEVEDFSDMVKSYAYPKEDEKKIIDDFKKWKKDN